MTPAGSELRLDDRTGWTADRADDGAPDPPPPTADVIQALEEQTTPELMSDLRRYAEGRATRMRLAGCPVPAAYARELVEDAHADTRLGLRPWDPARCDLIGHLRNAIRQRTWRELRRARRLVFVALHGAANDGDVASQIEKAPARSPGSDHRRHALSALLATTCQGLRRLVHHEREVTVLTRGWEDGLAEEGEILKRTGMSRAGYARARKRALYMSRQLPPELREAVRSLLLDDDPASSEAG